MAESVVKLPSNLNKPVMPSEAKVITSLALPPIPKVTVPSELISKVFVLVTPAKITLLVALPSLASIVKLLAPPLTLLPVKSKSPAAPSTFRLKVALLIAMPFSKFCMLMLSANKSSFKVTTPLVTPLSTIVILSTRLFVVPIASKEIVELLVLT